MPEDQSPTEAPKPAMRSAISRKKKKNPLSGSDMQNAVKLWIKVSACAAKGEEILIRDRSGLNTVLDIHNL